MDLIMLYTITHNLVELNFCSFFDLTNYKSTRGHNYKLAITMHASFRLLVHELTHGTIYPLTL